MSETTRNQLGRFTKGNPGKPKGAVNRTAKEARQILTEFLIEKSTDLHTLYDGLDAKDKAALLLHIGRLVLPRPDKEKTEDSPMTFIVQMKDKELQTGK